MAVLPFLIHLIQILIIMRTKGKETANNDITWCVIHWDDATRELLDDISQKSVARTNAPLNIPTHYRLALLTSENNIKIGISVSFSATYALSAFPCDPNGLTLSIKKRFVNLKYTELLREQQIAKTASIITKIRKNIDHKKHKIFFKASLHWSYDKWSSDNWNISLVFHESLNNINISSKPITVMNVPDAFEVSGSNPAFKYLYGRYSLSAKAQFTLFSTLNTNGVYFQDPSSGTTVFTFIYMGYIYPLSQWVFFDNYGELAKPTIASNYSIDDNFFIYLPQDITFIDNDANEFMIHFDVADKFMGDRIYNPYLECSVTQYLVNYLSAEGFLSDGVELNLSKYFAHPSAWYHIPDCVGKRCVFGVRLNRFDHFLILEYNDYQFDVPRWKLLQSWMFCWSLEWWLSTYVEGTQVMNETDELPTTVHYLPVSDCSLDQSTALKKKYGANQWMNRDIFQAWLDNLYLLIHRVIELKDDCRVDPVVLSLSRALWGAIGQCGGISYVDFDPQIFIYQVTEEHMESNMVQWMKERHIVAPSTKLGNEDHFFAAATISNAKPKQNHSDHNIIAAAAIVALLYILSLIIYLCFKLYRSKCVKYQSIE